MIKNLPTDAENARDESSIPGSERSPGGGNGNHSSILAGHNEVTEHAHKHTACICIRPRGYCFRYKNPASQLEKKDSQRKND